MNNSHKKITVGFVIQDYKKLPNGTLVCTGQEFIAGDQVDYENEMGETVEVDTLKEVYCPFEMMQPKHVPFPPANPIQDAYENFVCPDCGEPIPDDVVDGQSCKNCPFVFCLPRPDDN
jgi:hypothetical protein